jgi:hypothetical protein
MAGLLRPRSEDPEPRIGAGSASVGPGGGPAGGRAARRVYPRDMQFSRDLRDDVITGDITVSFRLWRRPKVKAGGRYPVGPARIEIDSVELMPFASITPADLRRSGEPDLESLRRRAAHAGPVADETLLYRVEFHLVGEAGA